MAKQKTDKELIQDYLGDAGGYMTRVRFVMPLATDRRRGRNYRVTFNDESSSVMRVYFNQDADGNQYVEEMN